jgi:hypothetical protein
VEEYRLYTSVHAYRKFLVISLISLILLSTFSVPVFGLISDLPEPPARPNTVDAVSGVGNTYGGGVLVIADPQPVVIAARNKVLGKIEQTNEKKTVKVKEESDWGLSMTGPVSNSEMEGILAAIRDLRPPREVTLSYELQGKDDERRTWTQTGTVYEIVNYKIYIVRQSVPAQNELVGILIVEKPVSLEVKMDSEDCPDPTPVVDVPQTGGGFFEAISDFFHWLCVDLPSDLGIYVFGTVKIYSGDGIAGVMHLRSGESKTIRLPPGSYTAKAVVRIFWISSEFDVGKVSADVPILLTVTLTTVEYGAIILVIILIIVVVILLYTILKRIFRRYHVKERIFGKKQSVPQPESPAGEPSGPATAPTK